MHAILQHAIHETKTHLSSRQRVAAGPWQVCSHCDSAPCGARFIMLKPIIKLVATELPLAARKLIQKHTASYTADSPGTPGLGSRVQVQLPDLSKAVQKSRQASGVQKKGMGQAHISPNAVNAATRGPRHATERAKIHAPTNGATTAIVNCSWPLTNYKGITIPQQGPAAGQASLRCPGPIRLPGTDTAMKRYRLCYLQGPQADHIASAHVTNTYNHLHCSGLQGPHLSKAVQESRQASGVQD